ncbi:MAG: phosphopyruvate hydratase [Thermoplasmata archaeon]
MSSRCASSGVESVPRITELKIRKILDSRGNPTIEVEVRSDTGSGRASAPSGASTGRFEAVTFSPSGIDVDVRNFTSAVAPALVGMDVSQQEEVDRKLHELDGTKDFSRIGGSVAIATSIAVAKAAADCEGLPFYRYLAGSRDVSIPMPLANVLGGGAHAVGGTDIQEFLSLASGPSVLDAVTANARLHKLVKEKLVERLPGDAIGKGDEGAWVASIGNEMAVEILVDSCQEVTKETRVRCSPSLDMAASTYYSGGGYHYREGTLSREEQIEFVADLIDEYGFVYVEDPLFEDDFEGFARLTELCGKKCLIVGDDLFVTNKERLGRGIDLGAGNAVIIKPNQIGTLTDTLETLSMAKKARYEAIVSHRSGETTDNAIAHIAIAFRTFALKAGAVGGERMAKLNELIRIEEELKSKEHGHGRS